MFAALPLALAAFAPAPAPADQNVADRPPNFVVIFCDDLGYGDLTCYGHPTVATPRLDALAAGGMRFTQFYCAAPVCTPSRAGLLTGRLPVRSGTMATAAKGSRRVLFPDSAGGLPPGEVTIAEVLKARGYATAAVGKWHLGHRPEYLPTSQGFDLYYGIPYSNDMDAVAGKTRDFSTWKSENFNVPLLLSEAPGEVRELERPVVQETISRRYAAKGAEFIAEHKSEPFFLYLAHSMPHIPLFAAEDVAGTSRRGLYGDVIEEIDRSVGTILDELERHGLTEDTLVVFTSDNGPWQVFYETGGSAGPLRGGKGGTFEGGMREPGIFSMPGTVPAGVVQRELGHTLDLLPTFAAMAGAELPAAELDGVDLSPLLTGATETGPRDSVQYWRESELYAVRVGPMKAHFITKGEYGAGPGVPTGRTEHDPPLLYDLEVDPGEQYNLAANRPEIVAELKAYADRAAAEIERGEDVTIARLPQ